MLKNDLRKSRKENLNTLKHLWYEKVLCLIWGSNFILEPRETLHILNSKGIKSIFSQARNIHDHLGLMKRSKSSLALFALLSSRKRLFFPFLIGGIKMWLKLGCKVHTENEKGAYKKELLIETYLTLALLSISPNVILFLRFKKSIHIFFFSLFFYIALIYQTFMTC